MINVHLISYNSFNIWKAFLKIICGHSQTSRKILSAHLKVNNSRRQPFHEVYYEKEDCMLVTL